MLYAKSKLEIAMERYAIRHERLGVPHLYRFPLAAVTAGATSAPAVVPIRRRCILLSLLGQPSDGAVASYAGLDLFLQIGSQDFCNDGQTKAAASFGELFGRAVHNRYDFEVPLLLERGASMIAAVINNTAGALTPSLHASVVELND